MPITAVKNSSLLISQYLQVQVLSPLELQPLAEQISAALQGGIKVLPASIGEELSSIAAVSDADIFIVIQTSEDECAQALNAELHSIGRPTLFVFVSDSGIRIGPWCHYGHTACLACVDLVSRCFPSTHKAPELSSEPFDNILLAIFIKNIFEAILSGQSKLVGGAVIHYDDEARVEYVLKDPLCHVCSIWSRQPVEALYA